MAPRRRAGRRTSSTRSVTCAASASVVRLPGSRRAALAALTALAFACATTRPPEGPLADVAGEARVALLEPDVELWLEGTRPIDPEESAQALEATHAAVARALDGRGLDAPDPDHLLAVHVRGVTRTSERRSAQVATYIGIVVVIVAIVVLAIVLSKGKSSGGSALRVHGAAPLGTRLPGVRPGAPPFVARPYYPPPPVGVRFGIGVVVPLEPLPPPPWVASTGAWLASRGWFDGDETEISMELLDARTGQPLGERTVRAGVDPRDAEAVARLVDRALRGQPFGARPDVAVPPPEPPPTAPPPPGPVSGGPGMPIQAG